MVASPSGNKIPITPTETDARRQPKRNWYRQFAAKASLATGSSWAFIIAALFLVVWLFSYPLFLRFTDPFDTWQLVINTVTTIVTFLMVFLIQNTQNRDARALHLKVDELIRAVEGARNHLVDLEDFTDEELDKLRKEFERIGKRAGNGTRVRAAEKA